jgi:uncharacterized membrane-anchored protein
LQFGTQLTAAAAAATAAAPWGQLVVWQYLQQQEHQTAAVEPEGAEKQSCPLALWLTSLLLLLQAYCQAALDPTTAAAAAAAVVLMLLTLLLAAAGAGAGRVHVRKQ